MHLWLLCCILLFVTARGYDWVSHQVWFIMPELSLPWIVLGGLGLAIASNRTALRAIAPDRVHKPDPPPADSQPTSLAVSAAVVSPPSPSSGAHVQQPQSAEGDRGPAPPPPSPSAKSISFTISKRRPGSRA